MSEVLYPVLLMILTLLFVVAEVFFPSMGILSLLATASAVTSVVLAFVQLSILTGLLFLLALFILVPLTLIMAFKVLPRTPFGKTMILDGLSGPSPMGDAVSVELEALVGKKGIASSSLRPSGIAQIDGQRVDVVTRGEMIAKGESLLVVEVEGNRIIVDRAEN